ncbi:MAG: roadblock/LC7 domain-containing protein [Burkholderiaceae bacterium]|nr:roadblock/LC7 domain-containing protein [Burkholderiaceae bacterium]
MAFDPQPAGLGMQEELDRLLTRLPSVTLAAVASEDGLLLATHQQAAPAAADRRAAVLASLLALARSAAAEHALAGPRWLVLGCRTGTLLVRPFGRQRKRLLMVVIADAEHLPAALAGARETALRIDARFG